MTTKGTRTNFSTSLAAAVAVAAVVVGAAAVADVAAAVVVDVSRRIRSPTLRCS